MQSKSNRDIWVAPHPPLMVPRPLWCVCGGDGAGAGGGSTSSNDNSSTT